MSLALWEAEAGGGARELACHGEEQPHLLQGVLERREANRCFHSAPWTPSPPWGPVPGASPTKPSHQVLSSLCFSPRHSPQPIAFISASPHSNKDRRPLHCVFLRSRKTPGLSSAHPPLSLPTPQAKRPFPRHGPGRWEAPWGWGWGGRGGWRMAGKGRGCLVPTWRSPGHLSLLSTCVGREDGHGTRLSALPVGPGAPGALHSTFTSRQGGGHPGQSWTTDPAGLGQDC